MVEPGGQVHEVIRTPGELPMGRHGIERERVDKGDEGLATTGYGRIRPMKRIAVVEREHAIRMLAPSGLEKGRDLRVPAHCRIRGTCRSPHQLGMRFQISVSVIDLKNREITATHCRSPCERMVRAEPLIRARPATRLSATPSMRPAFSRAVHIHAALKIAAVSLRTPLTRERSKWLIANVDSSRVGRRFSGHGTAQLSELSQTLVVIKCFAARGGGVG